MKHAILACSGMDKAEGSLAREVGIRVAEAIGADVICPVLLNRSPSRYRKALGADALIVVDGCATRCASKLALGNGAKPERKLLVSDLVKASGEPLEASLRLGSAEVALAEDIAADLVAALEGPATASSAHVAPAEPVAGWSAPGDYFVVSYEQFEFRVPKEGYWFNENDVWARVVGHRARVGLSDYLQQNLTDIHYYDAPEVGTLGAQVGEVGSVESSKAVFEIVAPVGGTVVAVNQALVENPELINEDPFGEGWLAELELNAWPEESEFLLDGRAYSETLAPKAAESSRG